jgi:hypothetical protein
VKRLLLLLCLVCVTAANAAAQSVSIAADPAAGQRGVLRVRDILADDELEEAVRSGLPLRVRFKVELWRDAFFDDLIATEQWTTVLTYEALSEQYVVRTAANARARVFSDFAAARNAIESAYTVTLRPQRRGRYYYTGSIDIETLSLSDLEELERWLKGELQPAVAGDRSIPGALGQGARRLLIRILSLPERRVEARSERFRLP